jgi:hypothetical protein
MSPDRKRIRQVRQGAAVNTLYLTSEAILFDFARAKQAADALAGVWLGEAVCMSWYDRQEDREAPAHVSECHDACDVPGYVDYAQSRGAELMIDVGGGEFVFCYRPLGEFADGE